jgi:hypothetical protein
MQITVTIPDEVAAAARTYGLSPESYVEKLIAEQGAAGKQPVSTEERLANLEIFFKDMAANSGKIPILSEEALTRESFYRDRD